jgi:class 3 adenylate cyclase
VAAVTGGIRYTDVGGGRVAYEVHGDGDLDLIYSPGLASHLDLTMEQPRYRRFIEGLQQYGRVIRFDRRGTGVSDPMPDDGEGWEQWADELAAILDDVGSRQAVLLATNDAGPAGILFAATQPERVHALVLFNTTARFLAAPGYEAGHTPETAELVIDVLRQTWGTEGSTDFLVPSMAADEPFRRWYARFQRGACPPSLMADNLARLFRMDARHVLPEVRCPTLVLHRASYAAAPPEHGRYLADHIPGALYRELPGADAMVYTEHASEIVAAIGELLGRAPQAAADDRVFTTVLFTDIVASTETAVALGDQGWRKLLDDHDGHAREAVAAHAGRVIKTTGDGILATFDAPTRAIGAARAVGDAARALGLDTRAGLHAGPVVVRSDGDIGGVAVNTAARVLARAGAGEVLVSRSIVDLVTADDVLFEGRGAHELKGLPGTHELFAVV